jgi:hypothetical protein
LRRSRRNRGIFAAAERALTLPVAHWVRQVSDMSEINRFDHEGRFSAHDARDEDRAGPYVSWMAALFALGLALLVLGLVRFSDSTEEISTNPEATAPTENLVPPASDGTGAQFDNDAPAGGAPSEQQTPQPGPLDVPGSD